MGKYQWLVEQTCLCKISTNTLVQAIQLTAALLFCEGHKATVPTLMADSSMSLENINVVISALKTQEISYDIAKSVFEIMYQLLVGNEYARVHTECTEAL